MKVNNVAKILTYAGKSVNFYDVYTRFSAGQKVANWKK